MPNLTAACSIDLQCSRVRPLLTSQCSQKPQLHIVGLSHGTIYTVLQHLLAQLKICNAS